MRPGSQTSSSFALDVITLEAIDVQLDPAEVLRYLGHPARAKIAPRIVERVHKALEDSRSVLRPRGTYSIFRIAASDARSLRLEGGPTFRGAIGEFLASASRAAVFLATVGQEVTALSTETIRAGDTLGGLILDAIGSHAVEAAVEKLVQDLGRRTGPGEALTLRYSPGYCGVSLSEQLHIFQLIDATRLGVELLPTLLMKPLKSVSGLIGIGPEAEVKRYGNPCSRCPRVDCDMRR